MLSQNVMEEIVGLDLECSMVRIRRYVLKAIALNAILTGIFSRKIELLNVKIT